MEPVVKCVTRYNDDELVSTMERPELAAFIERLLGEAKEAGLELVHAEAEFRFTFTNPDSLEKASLSVKVPARFLEALDFLALLLQLSR